MRVPVRDGACLGMLFFGIAGLGWSQTASLSYKAKCEVCHGTAGLADTAQAKQLKILPFNDPSVVAESDSTIIGIITNGSGKMPAYKGKLSDQEINGYIQFIRQVQNQQH